LFSPVSNKNKTFLFTDKMSPTGSYAQLAVDAQLANSVLDYAQLVD
jgi:hypothetical protein